MMTFSPPSTQPQDVREIPSTPLRAGSSLRLKNGCVQDDGALRLQNLMWADSVSRATSSSFPWLSWGRPFLREALRRPYLLALRVWQEQVWQEQV